MARCRRLLRARSSVDLTLMALALFVCVFIFRHLRRLEAVHFRQQLASDGDADVDAGGHLLEISLNNDHQQQQQHLASQVELPRPGQRMRLVDQRITNIGDVHTPDCHAERGKKSDVSVSIIVEYSDYEFYDMKNTVDSCFYLVHDEDSSSLIKQLIAVDSSSLDYIVDEARTYFSSLPKTTLLRSKDVRLSSAQARTAGVSVATGDVIVFIDSAIVCSAGWLRPLVDAALRHPDAILTPHLDRLRDPVSLEYEQTNASLVGTVSWDLAVRMRAAPPEMYSDDGRYIRTPALRGNMLAVRRDVFKRLGGYDVALAAEQNDAGHNLELSLRAWMCGVDIYTVPCSRVGVLNLRDPVKVTDMKSAVYIASLWLQPRLSIILNSIGHAGSTDAKLPQSLSAGGRCEATSSGRDTEWYLNNVASGLILPSTDAVKFGMLRVGTGRCARFLTATGRIALEDCLQRLYERPPKEMTFELLREGQLKVMELVYCSCPGLCLTVQNNAYVLAKDCVKSETRQQWKYTAQDELYNVWSRYCATHVTDPDSNAPGDRQIAMAQDCSSSKDDSLQFRAWQFIAD